MTDNFFNIQALKRQKARYVTYIDLLFALFPFFLIALQKFSWDIFIKSEWSLAASILYGQATARLMCGMVKYRTKYWHKGALYMVLLMIASLLSVFMYSILEDPKKADIYHLIIQGLLFFVSVFCFIVFGAVGQRLMDIPEKKPL